MILKINYKLLIRWIVNKAQFIKRRFGLNPESKYQVNFPTMTDEILKLHKEFIENCYDDLYKEISNEVRRDILQEMTLRLDSIERNLEAKTFKAFLTSIKEKLKILLKSVIMRK